MAEKKGVGHAYNVDFLNVVFAASSIFLFLSVIWMVWDDYDRDWKNTQRRFSQLELEVTQAELHYVGSVTIDEDLLDAANMVENEKVTIVNINNGERFETYIIKGERGTGTICLNGPAARKVQVGDVVIIFSYGQIEFSQAREHKPTLVFPDQHNRLV